MSKGVGTGGRFDNFLDSVAVQPLGCTTCFVNKKLVYKKVVLSHPKS